ncbi:MAG TPA: SGNH/GDSL hydrolase family protein [Cyclobacteriaceae bacterium]|nr:SGNH/GDSL hydrolase family protein [Cyclobacteriaceae bacterium]
MHQRIALTFLVLLISITTALAQKKSKLNFIPAYDRSIQYTGRIDFSDPKKPRFWLPGVYIRAAFKGKDITLLVNDENPGGDTFNYLEIVIDDAAPYRIQTTGQTNKIIVGKDLSKGRHTITVCKNTESNIGYLEFIGFKCKKILPPPPKPSRKLEFIGNSITCGTGVDLSTVDCGKGRWHDQHNAYMSYGPRVARALNAQWHLCAYSGIGLTRSCCNLPMIMPEVYDKVNMKDNTIPWNFQRYQPDAVTICLGQNDGIQDSATFCGAYVKFIETIRGHYPNTTIICLTSPMANEQLVAAQKNYLSGISDYMNSHGDDKVDKYFFSRSWNTGCDGHPDMNDHAAIAGELQNFLKGKLEWN